MAHRRGGLRTGVPEPLPPRWISIIPAKIGCGRVAGPGSRRGGGNEANRRAGGDGGARPPVIVRPHPRPTDRWPGNDVAYTSPTDTMEACAAKFAYRNEGGGSAGNRWIPDERRGVGRICHAQSSDYCNDRPLHICPSNFVLTTNGCDCRRRLADRWSSVCREFAFFATNCKNHRY